MITLKIKYVLICTFAHLLTCTFAAAQYFKLYEFTKNNDLSTPNYSQPVTDGTWFYDVASKGGSNGLGEVYKVKPDGTGYTKLLNFTGSNGSTPYGSLLLDHGFLYGMTRQGGTDNRGCIFKIDLTTGDYTKLFDFTASTGNYPVGGLIISDNVLYGFTNSGGNWTHGTIFKIKTDGSGFFTIYTFGGTSGPEDLTYGILPYGSPVLVNDTLYGTAYTGGSNNKGCVFKIKTDGTGIVNLHNFTGPDGNQPRCSLIYDQGAFYGTTVSGGSSNNGTVFKVTRNGTFTTLLEFDSKNTYGGRPLGSLVLLNGVLFGTSSLNGGSIFKLNTDSTGKSMLHYFGPSRYIENSPYGTLAVLNNELYGTTSIGNYNGLGCFFKITTTGTYIRLLNFSYAAKGAVPSGGLTLSGNSLLGVSLNEGAHMNGCFYKMKTDGSDFDTITSNSISNYYRHFNGPMAQSHDTLFLTSFYGSYNGAVLRMKTSGVLLPVLIDFNVSNGSYPTTAPVLSGYTLYGTCPTGGQYSHGCIYKANTNGTGKSTVYHFGATAGDGHYPLGQLLVSNDTIFGTADSAGLNNKGCIFKIKSDGTGYVNLVNCDGPNYGARPCGALIRSGNTLYGMTRSGGINNKGCIFSVNVNGSAITKLFDFSGTDDGAGPTGTLLLKGNIMYGVTDSGGIYNKGCFFRIGTDGNNYHKLLDFDGSNCGATPNGYLNISGDTIFGTTQYGGAANIGVIFSYAGSKITPEISWNNPADIAYGTLLSSAQLNATAKFSGTYVDGTFTYTPLSGTKLNVGKSQILQVDFTPADLSAYNTITKTVTINVNALNQTITFNALPQKSATDQDFDPGATASSQLPVTYISSDTAVATIVNGKVHIVGVGTSDITVSQAGNSTYNPADNVVQSLTVNKANQNITFNALAAKKVGDSDFDPLASASSGLPITYSSSNLTVVTIIDGRIHVVGAGSSEITASQAGDKSFNAAQDVIQLVTVLPATGIAVASVNTIDIYPNPFHGILFLKRAKACSANLSLIDISGHKVLSKSLTSELESLDVSGLQPGIYFLQVTADNKIKTVKVIIAD